MILVTGGAGYIGSHCVLVLQNAGYKVVVFDNLESGHKAVIGNTAFVQGDLKNPQDILRVFEQYKIDAVIHFAAKIEVAESIIDPQKYYYNNVYGTLNLLSAMTAYNVNKIIFSSTAAVYGEPQYLPLDENHPKNPINTYGMTKLTVENILDDYDRAYGLKSVRFRYFNVAGADVRGRTGEWHEPETHLIPNILKSAFTGGKVFEMYGDDYNTKDGTCIRDYVNVEDLAQAHVLGLKYLLNGGKTDCFNLGTKDGNSVKEVFALCEKITGKGIPVKIHPRRPGDAAVLVADNAKAKEVLGWLPMRTLEDSVKTAYEWERSLQRRPVHA
ncbi:MAG: UDP-glucose 4-epimerase GalE [Heliobacteriaceae bacterium]|jgi:UDP-glucose 4-epimerase|nr:UDP-glucose 4-epimerase GalE [Heliobacteriaceae bacterium]